MKKFLGLALIALLLGSQSTNAAARKEELRFSCHGPYVSAEITIVRSGTNLHDPYTTRTIFNINGRRVVEKINSTTTFFEQEIPFGHGAWEYDYSRLMYRLGGAELRLNWLNESFHLEMKEGPFGYVIGYLGDHDHESSHTDNSAFDFSCSRR